MLPSYDEYGSWPTSGEIDLVESRGDIIFIQALFSTLKQRKISFVSFNYSRLFHIILDSLHQETRFLMMNLEITWGTDTWVPHCIGVPFLKATDTI